MVKHRGEGLQDSASGSIRQEASRYQASDQRQAYPQRRAEAPMDSEVAKAEGIDEDSAVLTQELPQPQNAMHEAVNGNGEEHQQTRNVMCEASVKERTGKRAVTFHFPSSNRCKLQKSPRAVRQPRRASTISWSPAFQTAGHGDEASNFADGRDDQEDGESEEAIALESVRRLMERAEIRKAKRSVTARGSTEDADTLNFNLSSGLWRRRRP